MAFMMHTHRYTYILTRTEGVGGWMDARVIFQSVLVSCSALCMPCMPCARCVHVVRGVKTSFYYYLRYR